MSGTCQITAIIPTYNRSKLIGRAIESVLAQTFQAAQVIVVDDGSTDNTEEICRGYLRRIQYERRTNGGASASRNTGLRLAQEPWVAFLDSDDVWTPTYLERMAAAIQQTAGKAELYFSDMQLPGSQGGGTLWEKAGFRPLIPVHLVLDATAWVLMKRQPTMLQASVMSRCALERFGGLDVRLRLVHDSYLFCQLGIGGAACAVSGIGCVQTDDDFSETRVTNHIPLGSERHWRESRIMWRSVLRNHLRLRIPHRQLVRANLADAGWSLALTLLRSRRFGRGALCLLAAVISDPRFMVWLVRYRTRKGYGDAVRIRCQEYVPS